MNCIIDGCDNASWKGKMVGNLCMPCHTFLNDEFKRLEENKGFSQAACNRVKELKYLLMNAELFEVREKWEKN